MFHIKEYKQFDHRKEKKYYEKSNEEKTYATLKLGKTYKFAGYNWMACEVDNDCHVVVIQSHGVTHGAWPGYTMPQFGNGNYYSNSINGKDISDYDDKMRALYDDIKDAEDKAAPYGEGLYLISVEKPSLRNGITQVPEITGRH